MAQRPEGWRAPKSGTNAGYPHGKHKREARRKRAQIRLGTIPQQAVTPK